LSDCCSPKGYRWVFSEKSARAEARRYRKKGLDGTSKQIFDFLKLQGVEGRSVLEVGGGIGALQIELLKAGATRAVSVELTPTYEEEAVALLREAGLSDRVERKIMDFATAGAAVQSADIVIMNRVICCYPDMPRLAGAASDHAREMLVMSFPRRTLWMRAGLGLANLMFRAMRREFQIFLHPPRRILATSQEHGLRTVLDDSGFLWTVAALRRAA
jgi:2-polyprenyl-3-methyl-5-hydroxy-6-metoxy-1,4-benzoquinol methylase